MRPSPSPTYHLYQEYDDQGVAVGMDVDDADPADVFGAESIIDTKPADADFFNAFEDDFDDADIN